MKYSLVGEFRAEKQQVNGEYGQMSGYQTSINTLLHIFEFQWNYNYDIKLQSNKM